MLRAVSAGGVGFFVVSWRAACRRRRNVRFFGIRSWAARGKGVYGGFAVFFCGLCEEKVYLANLAVLLRRLYADHVKRLGFFALPSRTVRGKGGVVMLCGAPSRAAYVQRMGIRVFGAPLRKLTAGDRPISGSLRPPFRAWAGIGRAERHIFFFYAFLLISFFPCAILK